MARLTIASDETELAALAAQRVTQLIEEAVAARDRAFVSLAGGSTPRALYASLGDARQPWRDRIPWAHVHLFWGDERHVQPDHPDSNFGMAKTSLIDRVPIPADQVHRIRGEMADARDAAADYERTLNVAFALSRKNCFDLMLLGLGEDAHVASIFPRSELLDSPVEPLVGRPFTGRRAAAVWASHLNAWRITLTPAAILDSQAIVVLVSGAHKAAAVHAALEQRGDVKAYPAQQLRSADDRVEWFVDRAAAARL